MEYRFTDEVVKHLHDKQLTLGEIRTRKWWNEEDDSVSIEFRIAHGEWNNLTAMLQRCNCQICQILFRELEAE